MRASSSTLRDDSSPFMMEILPDLRIFVCDRSITRPKEEEAEVLPADVTEPSEALYMTFVSARLSSFSSCEGRRGRTWHLSGLHVPQVQFDSSVQRLWTCFSHWGLLNFLSAWLCEHRWHLLLCADEGGVYSPVMGSCLLMTVRAMSSRSSDVVLPDMVSRVV